MTAALLPWVPLQFLDHAGVPLASGKVYTYAAGSSTPKNSYTDESGATPNANPVILDGSGSASIWLNGVYKIVVNDLNDVLVWERDNVSVVDLNTLASGTAPGLVQLAVAADFPADIANDTYATTPAYVENAVNPNGRTAKTSVAQNDEFMISDSAASNAVKKVTLANLETQLETDLASWVNGLIAAGGGSGGGGSGGIPPTFTAFKKTAQTSFVAGTVLTVPHGLGAVPDIARAYLVCTSTTGAYTVGQVVPVDIDYAPNGGGRSFYMDATNFYFLHQLNPYGDNIGSATVAGAPSGKLQIDPTKWQVYFVGAVVNTGGALGSALLGTGSIDTTVNNGLLDLRGVVTNDVYNRIIIEIDTIVTTGGSGTSNIYFEYAQQGVANTASNYGQLNGIGMGVGSANFNQDPTSICKLLQTSGANLADGKASMKLYGFCSTAVKKWQSLFFQAFGYEDNGTVTSRVMATGFNEIWGNGGSDANPTDGLTFKVSGFTKATFNYRVYGVQ